jgi:hypothetical protein
MTAVNEITEAVLKNRLASALESLTIEDFASVDQIYRDGNFADFVGVVAKAQTEERQRAVNICNRLGHRQTAQVIAKGSSDV